MKKVIAITQKIIYNDSLNETVESLDIAYIQLIEELGFTPLILSSLINIKEYFSKFKIDGIILSGGNDLYCCNKNKLSKKRDSFEKALIKYAINSKIPILGICRGMQVISDYFNSSFERIENQVNINHFIHAEKKSKYFKELNKLKEVNSFHNFSIKTLSKNLIISAKSDTNIIKAIEHKNYKILAHMWHPERKIPFNKNELDLIKIFFTEEKK